MKDQHSVEQGETLPVKDGSRVKSVPGTDPKELLTLQCYIKESGFGYARITFYLLEIGDVFFFQLRQKVEARATEMV